MTRKVDFMVNGANRYFSDLSALPTHDDHNTDRCLGRSSSLKSYLYDMPSACKWLYAVSKIKRTQVASRGSKAWIKCRIKLPNSIVSLTGMVFHLWSLCCRMPGTKVSKLNSEENNGMKPHFGADFPRIFLCTFCRASGSFRSLYCYYTGFFKSEFCVDSLLLDLLSSW